MYLPASALSSPTLVRFRRLAILPACFLVIRLLISDAGYFLRPFCSGSYVRSGLVLHSSGILITTDDAAATGCKMEANKEDFLSKMDANWAEMNAMTDANQAEMISILYTLRSEMK
jgi:hypothetical protein